jgi:hypothetical protein
MQQAIKRIQRHRRPIKCSLIYQKPGKKNMKKFRKREEKKTSIKKNPPK